MKTSLLLPLACAALLVSCAEPQPAGRTARKSTPAESTSSRVKSDPTATRTYSHDELEATGQARTEDQLESRDPAVQIRHR